MSVALRGAVVASCGVYFVSREALAVAVAVVPAAVGTAAGVIGVVA